MALPLSGRPELRAFRPPLVGPGIPVRETPDVSFADLVRMLAEGVAQGQQALDRASADMVQELAETTIDIVPTITETIADDGTVTYERGPAQTVSLLDVGVTPTFYQFSEAVVEVAMDLKVVENLEEEGAGRSRFGLFAGTAAVKAERKLNRDVTVSSKLTAKMVPVPSPLRIDPVRTIEAEED
jgi:hypothetical protein